MVAGSSCPELRCQQVCDEYKEDPRTGCKTCECEGTQSKDHHCFYIAMYIYAAKAKHACVYIYR